jgi:5,10-methylenetetrahydromethanopterin reductase
VPREAFGAVARAAGGAGGPERAAALVTDAMLRVGVWGRPADLLPRLEWLVAGGVRHLSFGPPLGPDPLRAVELLGRHVLPHFGGGPGATA